MPDLFYDQERVLHGARHIAEKRSKEFEERSLRDRVSPRTPGISASSASSGAGSAGHGRARSRSSVQQGEGMDLDDGIREVSYPAGASFPST